MALMAGESAAEACAGLVCCPTATVGNEDASKKIRAMRI